MTAVLASVRSIEEAAIALQTTIGILDLKEPNAGALGAVDSETVQTCVRLAQKRCLVSATTGDLPLDPSSASEQIERLIACKVDYIKVGMFTPDYLRSYPAKLQHYTQTTALIAVLFADRFADLIGPVELLSHAGFRGVMLDTADKKAGGLLDLMSLESIEKFVQASKAKGMLCGLAGSLHLADIPSLAPLQADYLGFRTALCEDAQRNQALCANKLEQVIAALASTTANAGASPSSRNEPLNCTD